MKTLKDPQFIAERHPCPALVFAPPSTPDSPIHDADAMEVDHVPTSRERRPNQDTWVICGSESGKIVVWELNSRQVIQTLDNTRGHTRPVIALAVSPDSRYIASGSLEPDKSICVWKA